MTNVDYATFIGAKGQGQPVTGFEPLWLPDGLKDFQRHLTAWAIRRGRGELMEDCGLGKTYQQLVWAENVARKADRPVLIVTPLAVAAQTVREGEKFGIECVQSRDGSVKGRIVVTNYERLHLFNADDFAGVVCDEASAIKAFDGKRRKQVTRFLSHVEYRLLATATPAPNDFIELGTAAEALGEMTQSDMLSTFFKSSDNMRHSLFKEGDFWNRAKWFLKPHSEVPFWRWVASWSRACRTPSDLGFSDDGYVLPPLVINQHIAGQAYVPEGELFPRVARTLKEQREERKRSMRERCEAVAALVDHGDPAIAWCQYNEEGDTLERMIPGAVQVAGKDTDDDKEDRLNGFALGKFRVLVTKPGIAAWGMNYQHCGHHTFFPSHSYEQFYQALRRSLRFGRVGPVVADVVATKGEEGVTRNLQVKGDRGPIVGAYCIIGIKGGKPLARFVPVAELVKIRNNSKSKDSPAWRNWEGEMYRKCAMKRTMKDAPLSSEKMRRALEVDDADRLPDVLSASTGTRSRLLAGPIDRDGHDLPADDGDSQLREDEADGRRAVDAEYIDVGDGGDTPQLGPDADADPDALTADDLANWAEAEPILRDRMRDMGIAGKPAQGKALTNALGLTPAKSTPAQRLALLHDVVGGRFDREGNRKAEPAAV